MERVIILIFSCNTRNLICKILQNCPIVKKYHFTNNIWNFENKKGQKNVCRELGSNIWPSAFQAHTLTTQLSASYDNHSFEHVVCSVKKKTSFLSHNYNYLSLQYFHSHFKKRLFHNKTISHQNVNINQHISYF
jgi:hypothetical protein